MTIPPYWLLILCLDSSIAALPKLKKASDETILRDILHPCLILYTLLIHKPKYQNELSQID